MNYRPSKGAFRMSATLRLGAFIYSMDGALCDRRFLLTWSIRAAKAITPKEMKKASFSRKCCQFVVYSMTPCILSTQTLPWALSGLR